MTETSPESTEGGQSPESPGVTAASVSTLMGPKPAAYYEAPVQAILEETAPVAARRLQEFIERKQGHKSLIADMRQACEFVINHVVGKPTQKVAFTGTLLTYSDLASSAYALEKGTPRRVLADSMEITKMLPAGKVIDVEASDQPSS